MLLSAKYVFPISGAPISDGAVLVRNGLIEDVKDLETMKRLYPDEEVRDYGLAALLPGFVDAHTRLEKSVMRGVVADQPYAKWLLSVIEKGSRLELSDWYESAFLGCLDAISSGITTVADVTSTGAVLNAVRAIGIRSVIYREVGAMDKMRIDHAMNAAERDIDKWRAESDPDRVTIGISPAAIYANHPEVFKRASELAIKKDLPVALRLAASKEEYNFVMRGSSMFAVDTMNSEARGYVEIPPWLPFGVSPVKYALNWGAFDAENVLLIHGVCIDDADIKKLKEKDVSICTCPRANAQLGMGVAPLSEYLQAGLRVGLGTDSPAATESTDMLTEMRTGLLLHRARDTRNFLDSTTMLELATIGGARALGIDDEVGTLERGKKADIIALDLSSSHRSPEVNPVSAVVNTCTTADILMTMVGGNILFETGKWQIEADIARNIGRVIEIRTKLKS